MKGRTGKVLGLCDNHDAGAALCIDGSLHSAINEERLNRIKHFQGFPRLSIQALLGAAGLAASDIDLVSVASDMTPAIFLRIFRNVHRFARRKPSAFGLVMMLYVSYHVLCNKLPPLRRLERALSRLYLKRVLRKMGFRAEVELHDHHACHANAAYYSSGLAKALVVTMDANGDGVGVSVSLGEGRSVSRLYEQSGFSAPGLFYSRITEVLGFHPNRHEGKITGLAAFGDPHALAAEVAPLFRLEGGRIRLSHDRAAYRRLGALDKAAVAAAAQKVFEDVIVGFVELWADRTGARDVCLAGGVFSNVRLNQRLAQSAKTASVYVFPHMGDGGLALGAIYGALRPAPRRLTHLFLGPEPAAGPGEVRSLADRYGLRVRELAEPAREVARALAEGKIVGVHRGGQEFGPRALGNHSILYRTDDARASALLNEKLRRTEFMPFAPATLDEHFDACYAGTEKSRECTPFMTIACDCTSFMGAKSPAVVHVDRTARPQRVMKEQNPFLHEVLTHYHALTGIPSLLNTSFNIHEEPIVYAREDAVKTFVAAGLDLLLLDDCLVHR